MFIQPDFITDSDIEDRTLKLLQNYEASEGPISNPPVPIEKIIEFHLDLKILYDAIEDTNDEPILAKLIPSERTICLNERRRRHFDQYFGTEYFTLAHEVGHWDLHIHKSDTLIQPSLDELALAPVFLCRGGNKSRVEIQADRYASFLLMPEQLIRKAIVSDFITWSDITRLARQFAVSKQAMKIRLENLKLIFIGSDNRIYRSAAEASGQLSFL